MSPKVVDKQEKKEQIVGAAIHAFAKKGFAKTTINDIAAAAGIGKGTVYEYFKNKEEIIDYTFNYFMHSMQFDIEEILLSRIPALEKFRSILLLFSDTKNWGSAEIMELMLDFWAEGIKSKGSRNKLLKDMHRFYHSYREIFTDIILEGMSDGSFRKDINPGYVATMVVGALDGIMIQWLLDQENIDFQEVIKNIEITILKGISATSGHAENEITGEMNDEDES